MSILIVKIVLTNCMKLCYAVGMYIRLCALHKALVPMTIRHRKAQGVYEFGKSATAQLITSTCGQWNYSVVDNDTNKLLQIAWTHHLFEVCSSSERYSPCGAVAIGLRGFR